MFDPIWFLGIPPVVFIWILVKCFIEVRAANVDEREANKLYFTCVVDELVPHGLPDPDRFDDEE